MANIQVFWILDAEELQHQESRQLAQLEEAV